MLVQALQADLAQQLPEVGEALEQLQHLVEAGRQEAGTALLQVANPFTPEEVRSGISHARLWLELAA